jgi:hypothetical protein
MLKKAGPMPAVVPKAECELGGTKLMSVMLLHPLASTVGRGMELPAPQKLAPVLVQAAIPAAPAAGTNPWSHWPASMLRL